MPQGAREIRRRIASIQSTQQITKAMEMVAAARLRRSQGRVLSARPFSDKLHDVLARAVAAVQASGVGYHHPLLQAPDPERPPLYVIITADRGLAGPYNANVIRHAFALRARHPEMGVVVVGRKGRDAFQKAGWRFEGVFLHLEDEVPFTAAQEISRIVSQAFMDGRYSSVHLVYNAFINTVTHRTVDVPLLPIQSLEQMAEERVGRPGDREATVQEYLYEPSPQAVLDILLPRYVDIAIYRALLEAKTSEFASRMTAMRNASDNAQELIRVLTLSLNRARQAGITTEITEIVGGANALAE
ncbi:MAG TPA: ATP synthase F1 subunit gamma [Limnochorda sp.]